MREIDYEYIAANISTLTRIPVRVYRNSKLVIYCDPTSFPKDPAVLYIDTLLQIPQEVSYFISPFEQFYGIVCHRDYRLILGPTFQMAPSRETIREFMFLLGIRKNYLELFQDLLNSITPMPLELFLHELCLIYYFISEKKLGISDVIVYDSKITALPAANYTSQAETSAFPSAQRKESYENYSGASHTTFDFEQRLLAYVSKGDTEGLTGFFRNHSAGRAGKVASTYLRQLKNIFISTATLVSRAAIEGGMPPEEALSLSDRYIQHCENHTNPEQIINLQYNMVMDYTSQVAELQNGIQYNRFIRSVISYVREHLSDQISVEQMAKDLYVNRSYLSARFKKETGMALSTYIQEQQILCAKKYLEETDKPISEIAAHLGFSSQGYFQNVFKKHTGMTPKAFREKD